MYVPSDAAQVEYDGCQASEASQECFSVPGIMTCLKTLELKQDSSYKSLNRSMEAIAAEVRVLSHLIETLTVGPAGPATYEDSQLAPPWSNPKEGTLTPVESKPIREKQLSRQGSSETALQNMIDEDVSNEKDFYEVYQDLGGGGTKSCLTKVAQLIIQSSLFEAFIGLVIGANLVCVGAAIQMDLNHQKSLALDILDHIFLGIYLLELTLRFVADGRQCLANPWTRFDIVLVVLGVAITWVLMPLANLTTDNAATNFEPAKKILILRFLRMIRLARALRFFQGFSTLWRLINGILNSTSQIISTFILLTLTIYVFSCLGAELITGTSKNDNWLTSQDEKLRAAGTVVEEKFKSIPAIMMTLIQFVTVDSVSSIYTPLIEAQPALLMYFVPLMLILSITLMNLVTALLVEAAIESGQADKELKHATLKKRVKQMAPAIKTAFQALDDNGNGILTRDEIKVKQTELPDALLELLGPNSIMELFEMLDEDGSGEVPESEFVEGLLRSATSDVPMENQQMLKLMRINRRKIETCQQGLTQTLALLTSRSQVKKNAIMHSI